MIKKKNKDICKADYIEDYFYQEKFWALKHGWAFVFKEDSERVSS